MTGPGLREQLLLSETAKAAEEKKTSTDCSPDIVTTVPAMNTNLERTNDRRRSSQRVIALAGTLMTTFLAQSGLRSR